MNPKVTIVIPTLNVKEYIKQCIDSVLNQTLVELEVFVVDADSTDGTREILDEYEKKDSRIKVLKDIKKSTGYAKNIGIELSTAPYIAIVEPDDYIELDMMKKLYETAERTGADFVKSNFSTFLGSGKQRYDFPKTVSAKEDDYDKLIDAQEDNHCFGWVMFEWLGLYRKSFLNEFHIRHNESPGAAFQDTGFWFLTFSYARKIYLLKDVFYHYRCDNPYASVKNPNKVFNICKEYNYIKEQLSKNPMVWNRVQAAYYRGYFYDNYVVYNRISEELRIPLLKEMHSVLTRANMEDLIDRSLFSQQEFADLELLLESVEEFDRQKALIRCDCGQRLTELQEQIGQASKVIIYGAGSYGSNLQYLLQSNNVLIDAYVDGDEKKWNTKLNGISVLALEESKKKYPNALYLVANKNHSNEIEMTLKKAGIAKSNIKICKLEELTVLLI